MRLVGNVQSYFLLAILVMATACSNQLMPTASSPVQTPEEQAQFEFEPVTATPRPTRTTTPTAASRAFENGKPLAARVNEQPIFLETYQRRVTRLEQALERQGVALQSEQGQTALAQIQQQTMESLIDRAIIEQQAAQRGLTVTDDELETELQAATARLEDVQFEAWLAENGQTLAEFKTDLRAQLAANRLFEQITHDFPDTAEQIQLCALFVADKVTAQSVAAQLERGEPCLLPGQPASPAGGGELPWFPRGAGLVPTKVEAIAFLLQPGEVSGPIETADGFYIIKLNGKEAERPLTAEILGRLKKQKFDQWLAEQRMSARIERYVAL